MGRMVFLCGVAPSPILQGMWNYADKNSNIELTDEFQTATKRAADGFATVRSNGYVSSGKFSYRVTLDAGQFGVGVANATSNLAQLPGNNNSNGMSYASNDRVVYGNSGASLASGFPTMTAGSTVDICVDVTNRRIWFKVNGGLWNNNASGNPENGASGVPISMTGGLATGAIYAALCVFFADDDVVTADFGHSASASFPAFETVAEGVVPPSDTVIVSSTEELSLALSNALAGQTIRLTPGSYTYVGIANRTFLGDGATVRSDDPDDLAVIAGIELTNVHHLNIRHVKVTPATARSLYYSPFFATGCSYIEFTDFETLDDRVAQDGATYKAEARTAFDSLITAQQALPSYATWVASGTPANNTSATWNAWQAAILADPTCVSSQATLQAKLGATSNQLINCNHMTVARGLTHFQSGGWNFNKVDDLELNNYNVEDCYGDSNQFFMVRRCNWSDCHMTRGYDLPGDHLDGGGQWLTYGATGPSEDFLILRCSYKRGVGGAMGQGFFANNEDRIMYSRFTFRECVVEGSQFSAFSMGYITDLVYENCTVTPYTDFLTCYLQYQEATNVTINDSHVYDLNDIRSFYPDGLSTGVDIHDNFADQTPLTPPT